MQEALPSKKMSPKGAPNSLAGGREELLHRITQEAVVGVLG